LFFFSLLKKTAAGSTVTTGSGIDGVEDGGTGYGFFFSRFFIFWYFSAS